MKLHACDLLSALCVLAFCAAMLFCFAGEPAPCLRALGATLALAVLNMGVAAFSSPSETLDHF